MSGRGRNYWRSLEELAQTPEFAAIVERDAFLGVQFHPEKSGAAGARFLERCLSRG